MIRECNTKRASARANGISEDTLRKWVLEDPEFAARFAEAEGDAERKCLAAVCEAGAKDAKWFVWILKSRFGWSESTKSGDDDKQLPKVVLYLPDNGRGIPQFLDTPEPCSRAQKTK